jgi:peptide/nickel transport system substrate-binding protein
MARIGGRSLACLAALAAALGLGCAREGACTRCGTLVVAAVGEPSQVLPPLVGETVGRDVGDQVWERLLVLEKGGAPIDTSAYAPGLAERWERVDSLTLRFRLRPSARWHDGEPVTAGDVVFSFEAFTDSLLDTPARGSLEGVTATAEDSSTVLVCFPRSYAEQLYDATYHVRVIPAHIWRWQAPGTWANDTATSHLVGSGPYRFLHWDRGQSLHLVADTVNGRRTTIDTVVWRFASDPDAALNLVLAGEADLLETIGAPERVARVEADSSLRVVRYPAAAYGFLGYHVAGGRGAAPLKDRGVRRALNQAVNRQAIAEAIFGPGTKAPPGPMSQLLWIWDDEVTVLPYDTAAAASALDQLGWRRGAGGMRAKGGTPLRFDVLVPSTSGGRRRLAEALQEAWRLVGVQVTVTPVDFPVFQERLAKGQFDSYIGAWLDEPSPRSLGDQWTGAGIGILNYGGYRSAAFDQLFSRALEARSLDEAKAAWREALDTLNADAPALFLYAPVQAAAASRRLQGFDPDPFSWLSGLRTWKLEP